MSSSHHRSSSNESTPDVENRDIGRNSYSAPASNRSGFGMGFLIGLLTGSLLTLGLGSYLWFTQLRNLSLTATAPTAPAPDSVASPATASPTTASSTASETTASETIAAPQPASASSPAAGLAPTISGLGLQKSHPNGVTVRVESVAFTDDSILLNLNITNGSSREVELNKMPKPLEESALYLRDDMGNQYPVVPPADNKTVKIGASSTATGQFRFLGRIHPDVMVLTLKMNPGNVANSSTSDTPRFEIGNIPVNR